MLPTDNHANRIARLSPEKRALLELTLRPNELALPAQQVIAPIVNRGPAPLSFAQQRLWFLSKLDPDSSAYNQPKAIRLTGDLNFQALNKALDAIVERHEVLRTTLLSLDGESPVQLVGEPQAVELSTVDLTECSNADLETELQSRLVEMTERPFDLSRDLLLRATLLRLGPADHVLLLVTHHIASDGWSSGILWRELAILYTAFSIGETPLLPELPIQYADYAVWQRNWLQGEVLQTQISYWKKQLAEISVLQQPTDRPRPALQSYRGSKQSLLFSKALAGQLHALSRKEGVTLFMTLLAAFQTLLHRYSGQDDIALGSPIAGRTRAETEGLIGFFVNTLVLRTDLSGNPTFRELLDRVRKMALAAYEHQDLPFEKLVEELHPDRDLSHTPLFQVMFAHQNTPRQPLEFRGLSVSSVDIKNETAKFDLSLDTTETPQGLNATLEYNTDIFDDVTITRMMDHFQTLLEGIVANPNQSLAELPLLSEAEKHQLLVEWNDTKRDFPKDKCIHQLFEAQVEKIPDAVAVVFEDKRLTYRELNAKANQLAHYLRNRGVGPETLAAICVERSIEMVVGLLAILKAGGAYVPMDPEYPKARLEFMLRDTQAPVLLTQQRISGDLPQYAGKKLCLDQEWHLIAGETEENVHNDANPNNLAYIIYTSGSTGNPKGALITHGNLVNAYFAWEEAYQVQSAALVFLQMANIVFDVFSADWVRALCSGGKLVLCPAELLLDARQLYALMRREAVNCADFVPIVMRNLLNHLEETGQTLDFMRLLVVGSEVWYVEEYEKIQSLCGPNTRVMNSYGVTEATIDSSFFRGDVSTISANRTVPIGRPFANTQLYIIDRHLQPVPVGVPGELCISGAGLARGYLNRAEFTAEKFIANPFTDEPEARLYKTGDRARWLSNGNIEFLGRFDHQIKIRGFRVEVGEIEAVLVQHPTVRESVVVAREGVLGQKRLVAYVVTAHKPNATPTELRSFLQQKLPDYMVPSAYVFLESLPLTPNGKLDRRVLPAPDQNRAEIDKPIITPRDALEIDLTQVWEKLLGVKAISVTDNFFDLGGHSLLTVRLFAEIEKTIGRRLPLATIFQAPTIEQLASILRQDQWSESQFAIWSTYPSSVVPFQPNGFKPPLFWFNWGPWDFRLPRYLGLDQPVYGLQHQSQDGHRALYTNIEAMAAHYIKEIRTVQAKGPYYLGGLCIGGMVVFEMAQQLQQQGEEVPILVLLDPTNPRPSKLSAVHEGVTSLSSQITWFRDRVYRHLREIASLRPQEKLSYALVRVKDRSTGLWEKITKLGGKISWFGRRVLCEAFGCPLPPSLRTDYLVSIYGRAARAYVPQLYRGQTILFKTQGWYRDSQLRWGNYVAQGLEIQELDTDHDNVFKEPYVRILAEKLKARLSEVQRDMTERRNSTVDSPIQ